MFPLPCRAVHQSSATLSAWQMPSDVPDMTAAVQARWVACNVDRLFGAAKRGAVERLLATVCFSDVAPGSGGHTLCLESFCALADLAKQSHARKFSISMGTAMCKMADGSEKRILAYRLLVEDLVLADRGFLSEPRESMLHFIRKVEHLGMVPGAMRESWCFPDAALINRLADVLPDENALHVPAALNVLALDIDELNAVPEYRDQPHVAMAAKAMLLAHCFPDHRFDIHFRREMRIDDDSYFLSVRPKINYSRSSAIAKVPTTLYSATVLASDTKQILALLIRAIQLRVSNELEEHRSIIDSSADLIARHRDAMTRDAATRRFLVEQGDDPTMNGDNYRFLGVDAQAQTFAAAFGDQTLVFSNVPPLMGELRGERLQALLQSGRYRTLDELMATGHRSASDPILRAAMSPLKNDVSSMRPRLDPDGVSILAREVGRIRVADTTLGALWDPIPPYVLPNAAAVYGPHNEGMLVRENPGPEGAP